MKCGYFFLPEAGFIFSLKGHCDKTKTHLRRGIIYLWSGSPLHSGTLFIFLIFCGQISPSVTSFLSDIQCWFWVLVEVWPHYTYCLCFSWKSRLETWMIPQNHFNLLVMSWKVWENSCANGKRTRTSLYDRKLISSIWFISYLRCDHT